MASTTGDPVGADVGFGVEAVFRDVGVSVRVKLGEGVGSTEGV